jgi:hypothetical protein
MDSVPNIREVMAISELKSRKEQILEWMAQGKWEKDSGTGIMQFKMDLEEISSLDSEESVIIQFNKLTNKIKF